MPEEYIRFGGFPIIALGRYDEQSAYQIVNGIYHTVISRDIVKRHRINRQDLFDRVVKYIVENMGKTFFFQNAGNLFYLLNHQAAHVTGIREKSLFFCHKIPQIPHFFVASIRLAGRKREIIIQHCVPENVSFHPASFLQLSDTRYDSGW